MALKKGDEKSARKWSEKARKAQMIADKCKIQAIEIKMEANSSNQKQLGMYSKVKSRSTWNDKR
jgi:hypothetical protein